MTKPFEDDGRTLVSMNVEGMPWYRSDKEASGKAACDLTARELWFAYLGALKASLVLCLLFCGGFAALVLFCLKVWFV